jgi:hypothetical protein
MKRINRIPAPALVSVFRSFLIFTFLILAGFLGGQKAFALSPVHVSDFTFGGTAKHSVGGVLVPNPGAKVIFLHVSVLTAYGYYLVQDQGVVVLTADSNGHFETQVPVMQTRTDGSRPL